MYYIPVRTSCCLGAWRVVSTIHRPGSVRSLSDLPSVDTGGNVPTGPTSFPTPSVRCRPPTGGALIYYLPGHHPGSVRTFGVGLRSGTPVPSMWLGPDDRTSSGPRVLSSPTSSHPSETAGFVGLYRSSHLFRRSDVETVPVGRYTGTHPAHGRPKTGSRVISSESRSTRRKGDLGKL